MQTRVRRHKWRPNHIHVRFPQTQPENNDFPEFILGPGGQESFDDDQPSAPSPSPAPPPPPEGVPQHQSPQSVPIAGSVSSGAVQPASSSAQPATPLASSTGFFIAATSSSSTTSGSKTASAGSSQSILRSSTATVPASSGNLVSSSVPSTVMSVSTLTESESFASTSTSSSPNSSSAVAVAVTTSTTSETDTTSTTSSTASSTAAPSPNNFAAHKTPFYILIVVGIIVVIACLTALIAWWVRLHSHARRRRSQGGTIVPWANHTTNDDNSDIEEGQKLNASNPGGTENLNSQWELRGDRDVGEPKRTESFLGLAPVNPFSTPSASQPPHSLLDSVAYPLPIRGSLYPKPRPGVPTGTNRYLDEDDGSVDDHGSAVTLGPLHVANRMPGDASVISSPAVAVLGARTPNDYGLPTGFGTPRENVAGSRPRFWGLQGDGLAVPWGAIQSTDPTWGAPVSESIQSINSTRRASVVTKPVEVPNPNADWEHLPPLPIPGPRPNIGPEGWGTTIRSSLVSAFNAVAANLSSSEVSSMHEEDILTPAPTRRGDAGDRHAELPEWQTHGESFQTGLSRGNSTASQVSTVCLLEETGNGAGIVHITSRGSGSQSYRSVDNTLSPRPFFSRQGSSPSVYSQMTRQDTEASMDSHFEQPIAYTAKARRETQTSGTGPRSAHSPALLSQTNSISLGILGSSSPRHSARRRKESTFVRMSSSYGSADSFGSTVSGMTVMDVLTAREEAARSALRDRRQKVAHGLRVARRDDLRRTKRIDFENEFRISQLYHT